MIFKKNAICTCACQSLRGAEPELPFKQPLPYPVPTRWHQVGEGQFEKKLRGLAPQGSGRRMLLDAQVAPSAGRSPHLTACSLGATEAPASLCSAQTPPSLYTDIQLTLHLLQAATVPPATTFQGVLFCHQHHCCCHHCRNNVSGETVPDAR